MLTYLTFEVDDALPTFKIINEELEYLLFKDAHFEKHCKIKCLNT